MKGHVPWSGAGCDRRKRHRVRDELARSGIQVPDIDLVGAKIDTEHVIAVEVGKDLVRVRSFLAGRIRSGPVADALEIICLGSDRTVSRDAKNLKVAACVAGSEQILVRRL